MVALPSGASEQLFTFSLLIQPHQRRFRIFSVSAVEDGEVHVSRPTPEENFLVSVWRASLAVPQVGRDFGSVGEMNNKNCSRVSASSNLRMNLMR